MEKAIVILYCSECGKQHGSAVMNRSTVSNRDETVKILEDIARTLDDGCCGSVHDFRILLSGTGGAHRYAPVPRLIGRI